MSNERENNFKCISSLPLVYLVYPNENSGIAVIMASITEEQEKQLDAEDSIVVRDQFDKTFVVEANACYAYGKLNLSPKSDDIKTIKEANWFKGLYVNIAVPSNYDYDSHTITSSVTGGQWYETDNISKYLPFLYGKIGKPERVVIFKRENDMFGFKKKAKNRNRSVNRKHYVSCKEYYQTYSKNKTVLKRRAKVSNLKFKIKK